jgi:methionine-rich copper-binding protein CopC
MRLAPSTRGLTLAFAAWLIGASVALAHSELRRAEPAPNSKHKSPPNEVKLSFTERLEPAYSTVRVVDAHGAEVDRQDAHVDPVDRLLLRASLKPLDPGAYTVNWRALSLDPHVAEGHFTFQVE